MTATDPALQAHLQWLHHRRPADFGASRLIVLVREVRRLRADVKDGAP